MPAEPDPRIAPGRFRELGPINWVIWRALSRVAGAEDAHLFSTLGRTRGLFRGWLHYSGKLMPGGRLDRHDAELVILRVAILRECDYELDHHIKLGARAGIGPDLLDHLRIGPNAGSWSSKHRALLTAVDQLVATKDIGDTAWRALADEYDELSLIEIVLLINQYDGLASTISTLRIQRDGIHRLGGV